jgi:hypothetical protein
MTYVWLRRMLAKYNIKCVDLLHMKITSRLRLVEDDLGLRNRGVYSIPCLCGQVYIRQTGGSIETRIKEHHQHIRLGHQDKSAVAEHTDNRNHLIKFQDTWILSTVSGYVDYLLREAVVLELHPNYMNREDGLTLCRAWKHLFHLLRDSRWPPQYG